MNIFFADGDGASLPPSKVQLATERHLSTAHSARAQHRLLEEMDRAMSEDLETRLRSLLELANQRESRQQLPDGVVARLSRLHRPPEELAVDYSDGCARARLRWLMVLADAANSKAVVEFKAV